MADINIPGVSDKYKTKDLIAGLMEAERIPLKREQEKLDGYKTEQQNWRRVNQQMTTLRDSARNLFSFNNPFNEKNAISGNEGVVTAEAGREAQLQPFKVQVVQTAAADRFLSVEMDKNYTVPAGTYTFATGDKSVGMNWRGGTLTDFVNSLNKRSNGIIKASLISVNGTSRALLLESLRTGEANKLEFQDDALKFALDTQLIRPGKNTSGKPLSLSQTDLRPVEGADSQGVNLAGKTLTVPPLKSVEVPVLPQAKEDAGVITFSAVLQNLPESAAAKEIGPVLPQPAVNYKGISVLNAPSDANLPPVEPPVPVETSAVLFIKNTDGSTVPVPLENTGDKQQVSVKLADYPELSGIEIKNGNSARQVTLSDFQTVSSTDTGVYEPVKPVDRASDAVFTYEGIRMTRPSNKIDDAVPFVTLNLQSPSPQPVTINIEHNIEAAKNSIISFVGNYNQLLAELNILTQNKPEVVTELEYLTDAEREAANKRLGSLLTDFTLNNSKQTLQRAVASSYVAVDNAAVKLLSDLGISSKTAAGAGVNAAQLRGYLEIDEKKLDQALKNSMEDIKNLFGFDSNSDMVIDNGLAFQVEKQLQSYTQIGGIIATKSSGLDTRIKSSETQIRRLETQIAAKEAELKRTYGQMESTLNNLNSQSSAISNFSSQNSGQKN